MAGVLGHQSCWLHNSSRSLQARSDLRVSAGGTLSAVGDTPRSLFQILRWYREPSGGGQCPIHVARESQQHLDRKSIKAFKLLAHLFSRCEENDYKHLQAIHTHTSNHIMSCLEEIHNSWISQWSHFSPLSVTVNPRWVTNVDIHSLTVLTLLDKLQSSIKILIYPDLECVV